MGRFGVAGVAALCGVLAACPYFIHASGTPGSLILVYLSQLPLFVGGLWGGVTTAALAGLTASLMLLAASNIIAVIVFAALNVVPVILLVRQALLARTGADGTIEWYPPGLLAAWLTGLGLMGIIVTLLVFGGPDDIQVIVRNILSPALDRLFDEGVPGREELAGHLAMIMPGVVIASWMVMTLTNGTLAQGLLTRFGASWRPSPALAALELPGWFPVLLLLAATATALGGVMRFLGVNAIIILSVPFCLAGLAVLHAIAHRFSRPAVPLVGVYILAGLLGWPLVLVSVLGLLDTSFGLRRHIRVPRFIGGKKE
jgi:uncharacterized protein YybS (DUF2232 family)